MRKIIKNNSGFSGVFFLFFLFIVCSVVFTNLNEERMAIADEVKTGAILPTERSIELLRKVDDIIDKLYNFHHDNPAYRKGDGWVWWERDWQTIFFAKIMMERARIDMELKASQK